MAAVLSIGFLGGGCAMSQQLGSLFGSKEESRAMAQAQADSDVTGSIGARKPAQPTPGLPPDADLAYCKAAVAEVLARGKKDLSSPWENPRTGARGTVTPIAAAYTQDGATCHDFLASYVQSGKESWMRGEACRSGKDRWEVKALRPWKRS